MISAKDKTIENLLGEKVDESKCPECGSSHISIDDVRAEVFCDDCGRVIKDKLIDQGPEWISHEDGSSSALRGVGDAPKLRYPDNLGTKSFSGNHDGHGRKIAYKTKIELYRLRKAEAFSRPQTIRNLTKGLDKLFTASSKLGIPVQIRESAAYIFRHAQEKRLTRGCPLEETVAASINIAALQAHYTLNVYTLAKQFEPDKEKTRYFRKCILKRSKLIKRKCGIRTKTESVEDCISNVCSKLELLSEEQRLMVKITCFDYVKYYREKNPGFESGLIPWGLAASIVYAASKIMAKYLVTQRELAKITNVTEVTLRNNYRAYFKGDKYLVQLAKTYIDKAKEC